MILSNVFYFCFQRLKHVSEVHFKLYYVADNDLEIPILLPAPPHGWDN